MRAFRVALAVAGVLVLTAAEGLDEGELHCEEAVQHLSDCCHLSFPSYDCEAGRGCDDTRPNLDDPLATDVRDTSCDQVVGRGWCQMPPNGPVPHDFSFLYDLSVPRDSSSLPIDFAPSADLESSDGGGP
jgi:hypothetical protein